MRRASLRFARFLPVVVLLPLLTGCTGKLSFTNNLKSALDTTSRLPRHYVYTEKFGGKTYVVSGDFEDDFRYSASLSVDGKPMAAEVMRDDARALRMTADLITRLGLYTKAVDKPGIDVSKFSDSAVPTPNPQATPDPNQSKTSLESALTAYATHAPLKATVDLLAQGNWVVDPTGAGPLGKLRRAAHPPQIGDDPVADALTVFTYVRNIADLGDFAKLYNPDAVDYRPDLDPFPAPPPGEIRIDFQPGGAPQRVSTATGTIDQLRNAVPEAYYYRSLSIYVKDGVVQQIRESVNIKRRLVTDPADDILGRIVDAGVKVPDDVRNGSLDKQAAFILGVKNQFLASAGRDLIRERALTVDFSYPTPTPTVSLPAGALAAFLGGIVVRGQIVDQGTTSQAQ